MWELRTPDKTKLIIGILATDDECLKAAKELIIEKFGQIEMVSDIWPFKWTGYYKDETGTKILRQFVTIKRNVAPGRLAKIKLKTNRMEKMLAEQLIQQSNCKFTRPINLDPGLIEPSKLVLASTKNFAHRIYVGKKVWAEVTLLFDKGQWKDFDYTYPDYKDEKYQEFFSKARLRLVGQLKGQTKSN